MWRTVLEILVVFAYVLVWLPIGLLWDAWRHWAEKRQQRTIERLEASWERQGETERQRREYWEEHVRQAQQHKRDLAAIVAEHKNQRCPVKIYSTRYNSEMFGDQVAAWPVELN